MKEGREEGPASAHQRARKPTPPSPLALQTLPAPRPSSRVNQSHGWLLVYPPHLALVVQKAETDSPLSLLRRTLLRDASYLGTCFAWSADSSILAALGAAFIDVLVSTSPLLDRKVKLSSVEAIASLFSQRAEVSSSSSFGVIQQVDDYKMLTVSLSHLPASITTSPCAKFADSPSTFCTGGAAHPAEARLSLTLLIPLFSPLP